MTIGIVRVCVFNIYWFVYLHILLTIFMITFLRVLYTCYLWLHKHCFRQIFKGQNILTKIKINKTTNKKQQAAFKRSFVNMFAWKIAHIAKISVPENATLSNTDKNIKMRQLLPRLKPVFKSSMKIFDEAVKRANNGGGIRLNIQFPEGQSESAYCVAMAHIDVRLRGVYDAWKGDEITHVKTRLPVFTGDANKHSKEEIMKMRLEWFRSKCPYYKVPSPDDQCSICCEPLRNGKDLFLAMCDHVFHDACMKKWVQSSGGQCCPLCRHDPEDDFK